MGAIQADTGVPVVIDAAASFDALQGPYDAPMVVSLHATKALGAGEGGFVVRPDPEFIQMTQRRGNFGFFGSREAVCDATNAKISEYHAAAALDAWPETRHMWRLIARSYLNARLWRGLGRLHLRRPPAGRNRGQGRRRVGPSRH